MTNFKGTIRANSFGATRCTLNHSETLVTIETVRAENVDGFDAMNGFTIAQTVAMKIEGFHGTRNGAHDLRKTPAHFLAVY